MNENNYEESPINILDYFDLIKKKRKLIAIIVGVSLFISIVYSLLVPKIYRGNVSIMPINSGGSMGGLAAMAGQLSGLPFMGGMLDGAPTPIQQFMVLLESRSLAENIINEYDLMPILFADDWDEKNKRWDSKDEADWPTMEAAINVLRDKYMSFEEDAKNAIIKVHAMFETPELAAKIANGYVQGLQDFINKNELTVAKRNRIFIEKQLMKNKQNLISIGTEINEFYKEGRVSNIESRLDVSLVDNIDADQLIVMNVEDSDQLSNDVRLTNSLLNKKIKEMRVIKNVPQQVYLQYLTLRRELLGKINALLTQQYEMAKIEEAKKDLAFQVIDRAHPPKERFKPKRKIIVLLTLISSFVIAVFFVFFLEYIEQLKKRPRKV